MQCRSISFRYRSSAHRIEVFHDCYGPTSEAFAALDASGQRALHSDIARCCGGSTWAAAILPVVPGEDLEVVITKR